MVSPAQHGLQWHHKYADKRSAINLYSLITIFKQFIACCISTDVFTFQIVAAFMMIDSLNKKGYNAYAISVPSTDDLMIVFKLAAPAFIMMISKVYDVLTRFYSISCVLVIIVMHLTVLCFRWLSFPSSYILLHLWTPSPWPLIRFLMLTLIFFLELTVSILKIDVRDLL